MGTKNLDVSGGGNGPEGTIQTYLKNWLILSRVQSLPVSIITVVLGYATVSNSVFTLDVVTLCIIVSIGHLSAYTLNDVFDYEYDVNHKSDEKPLVTGIITPRSALVVATIALGISIILALIYFPQLSGFAYLIACVVGLVYNKLSKQLVFSSIYLGIWGMSIVFTGSLYAGGYNIYTLLISCIIFIHMISMTVVGDLKDLHAHEPSIPRELGCGVYEDVAGDPRGYVPLRFKIFWVTINIVEILLAIHILILSSIAVALPLAIILSAGSLIGSNLILSKIEDNYNPDGAKKLITIRELMLVSLTLIASVSFIEPSQIISLLMVSFIWGLTWLKILFGDWLYFA